MPRRGQQSEESDETRQRLLEAGLAVLIEEPAEELFVKLQARPISARAGLSTGAFYHHFRGADEYAEALLHHSLNNSPNPELAVLAPEFEARVLDGASFVDAFLAATDRIIEFNRTDPSFKLMLAVAARSSHDRAIRDRLRGMYRTTSQEIAEYCDLTREALGREWRPPFTKQDLGDAFLAVFEGMGLRQAVDPDAVPPQRFGLILLAIIDLMSRPGGSDDDLGQWLSTTGPAWPAQ